MKTQPKVKNVSDKQLLKQLAKASEGFRIATWELARARKTAEIKETSLKWIQKKIKDMETKNE